MAAVHAEIRRLVKLHDDLGSRFQPGDRLVYLGNMIGRSPHALETIEELLMFRRALLAVPGLFETDIVYLRGGQEEMWQKLLQLQLAPNPREIMAWMLSQGLGATLESYGSSADQARAVARDSARSIARFTGGLRETMRKAPGHEPLFSALRRAAFTGSPDLPPKEGGQGGVLLVSAGFDIERSFEAQGDAFWWGSAPFARIDRHYGGFARIVRGHDPAGGGFVMTKYTLTVDAGCGGGGPLVCACLSSAGELLESLEA
ncbi:MAG: hypothetical protein WCO00_18095 [Rhodospirillaceae bacterium]